MELTIIMIAISFYCGMIGGELLNYGKNKRN